MPPSVSTGGRDTVVRQVQWSAAVQTQVNYHCQTMIVHRCLNGRAPPYLSDYCVPAAGADTWRKLRSSNRQLLAVPRYRFNTYGCWAFTVAGPTVWNSLVDFIRDPTISADCFRRLLRRACLLDTSALSALGVLWRLLRYINLLTYLHTYLLTYSRLPGTKNGIFRPFRRSACGLCLVKTSLASSF